MRFWFFFNLKYAKLCFDATKINCTNCNEYYWVFCITSLFGVFLETNIKISGNLGVLRYRNSSHTRSLERSWVYWFSTPLFVSSSKSCQDLPDGKQICLFSFYKKPLYSVNNAELYFMKYAWLFMLISFTYFKHNLLFLP